MPTEDHHLVQARHNEEFVQHLMGAPRFSDWAATGIFYAAVHYVEAAFDARLGGFHTFSHAVREFNLSRILPDPRTRLQYHRLKSASMLARYLTRIPASSRSQPARSFFTAARIQEFQASLKIIKQTLGYPESQ